MTEFTFTDIDGKPPSGRLKFKTALFRGDAVTEKVFCTFTGPGQLMVDPVFQIGTQNEPGRNRIGGRICFSGKAQNLLFW